MVKICEQCGKHFSAYDGTRRFCSHSCANTLHGHTRSTVPRKSKTYTSWQSMHRRCNDPKVHNFNLYGGKGIKVCDYWDKFENFLEDMGERPAGMTIDRIDNNSHYMPSNCRWATPLEQRQH